MYPGLPFVRSRHKSSRGIFSAYALSNATRAKADHVLDLYREYGISHIDTAAIYGKAEERIGPWMDQHSQHFFLATKIRSRTY